MMPKWDMHQRISSILQGKRPERLPFVDLMENNLMDRLQHIAKVIENHSPGASGGWG